MANYNEDGPFVKTEDRAMGSNIIENKDYPSTGVSDSIHRDDVIRASDGLFVRNVESDSTHRVI